MALKKDKTEAIERYRKAARQGNGNAMSNLGAAYYDGEGVQRSDTLAYAWFLLSSQAGKRSHGTERQRKRAPAPPRSVWRSCI
jgi:TPR repeat protein